MEETPLSVRLKCDTFQAFISHRQCMINQVARSGIMGHLCGACSVGKEVQERWPTAYRAIMGEKGHTRYGWDGTPHRPLPGKRRGQPQGTGQEKLDKPTLVPPRDGKGVNEVELQDAILKVLKKEGPQSRAKLAKKIEVTIPVLDVILTEMEFEGLVVFPVLLESASGIFASPVVSLLEPGIALPVVPEKPFVVVKPGFECAAALDPERGIPLPDGDWPNAPAPEMPVSFHQTLVNMKNQATEEVQQIDEALKTKEGLIKRKQALEWLIEAVRRLLEEN